MGDELLKANYEMNIEYNIVQSYIFQVQDAKEPPWDQFGPFSFMSLNHVFESRSAHLWSSGYDVSLTR